MTDVPAAPPAPQQSEPLFGNRGVPEPKPATPAQREWAELSPNERFERQQAEGDAHSGRYDPAKVIQTRDRGGNLILKDRATGKVIADPATSADAPPAGEQQLVASAEKVRVGELEVSEAELRELMKHKAEADLRATQIPATAGEYKLELPEGTVLPGDVQVSFDINVPLRGSSIQAAQAWAKANNLSQSQFSELLALHASASAAEASFFEQRKSDELAKLGAIGPARIDAVTRWLTANFGSDVVKPVAATMATAAHVQMFEKIIGKLTSQGAAPFSQQHRDPNPERVSDEAWNAMTYSERKSYAERSSAGGR
jgi:hypothetical protein